MSESETMIDSADVLSGQLEDILVVVSPVHIRRLERKTLFHVLDWVEAVKEATAQMQRVPPPPSELKRWLRPEQLSGKWESFTTWRPPVKRKEQALMF